MARGPDKPMILATFLLSLIGVIPAAPQQTPATPLPVIVVNGSAQIDANPDQATVRLGILRQASAAQTAQEQANTAAKDILAAVTKAGIPARKIQTSRLTLTPNYRGEPARIAGYSASNIITIEVDDLTRVGPVIDAGLGAGANQLEGVRFQLKDDITVRERALTEAVVEARRKAEVIATALGAKLAGVLEVTEGGVSVFAREEAAYAMRSVAVDTPVSPGQLTVSANVTVKYRITEGK